MTTKRTVRKAFRPVTVALLLAAAIAPAIAQFPSTPDDPQDSPQLAGTPKGKKGGAGPNINGNWTGQLTQVGSQTPYKFELAVNARVAETRYPDLDCSGKLTRAGSSSRMPSSSK